MFFVKYNPVTVRSVPWVDIFGARNNALSTQTKVKMCFFLFCSVSTPSLARDFRFKLTRDGKSSLFAFINFAFAATKIIHNVTFIFSDWPGKTTSKILCVDSSTFQVQQVVRSEVIFHVLYGQLYGLFNSYLWMSVPVHRKPSFEFKP